MVVPVLLAYPRMLLRTMSLLGKSMLVFVGTGLAPNCSKCGSGKQCSQPMREAPIPGKSASHQRVHCMPLHAVTVFAPQLLWLLHKPQCLHSCVLVYIVTGLPIPLH